MADLFSLDELALDSVLTVSLSLNNGVKILVLVGLVPNQGMAGEAQVTANLVFSTICGLTKIKISSFKVCGLVGLQQVGREGWVLLYL